LLKKKKSLFKNKYFWLGLFCFVLAIFLFWFLFFSEVFQVRNILIAGEDRVDGEQLRQFIEARLEKKILFFPTKSIFVHGLAKHKKEILESFPQVATVEMGRDYPNSLNVLVLERKEAAFWCQEAEEKESCFLVDREGIIFEPAIAKLSLVEITKPGLVETKLNLGDRIIEEDLLGKIIYVKNKMEELLRTETKEVIVLDEYFKVRSAEGWLAFFNPGEDLDWQVVKLGAVLEEKIPSERMRDLEYVDLRFGNLAPFKYREPLM